MARSRRPKDADEHDHYGRVGPAKSAAPDLGPLFGGSPDTEAAPAAPPTGRQLPKPGARLIPPPPSYDTVIGPRADRARAPERVLSQAHTAPGSATSREAARSLGDNTRKAYTILGLLEKCGARGATRVEVAQALGIPLSSVCSTMNNLYRRGLVGSNPGDTRRNPDSGKPNEVMLHEDHVRRWNSDQQRPAVSLAVAMPAPTSEATRTGP